MKHTDSTETNMAIEIKDQIRALYDMKAHYLRESSLRTGDYLEQLNDIRNELRFLEDQYARL